MCNLYSLTKSQKAIRSAWNCDVTNAPQTLLLFAFYAVLCTAITGADAQPISPAATQSIIGQASVIDGDTIEIHGTRIRLHGIDAPESGQACEALGNTYRCGQRAAIALDTFLGSQTVKCQQTDTDRWKRVIARCLVREIDLGKWMVENGWAIAYRRYSTEYVDAEQQAQSKKLGVWAGEFTTPEEWRRVK